MASGSAAQTFERAIRALKETVTSTDATAFQSTTIEDVWKSAETIQETQRQRKSLKNMARIEPFLKALEKYSKVIEVVCNGTDYLPWIWAPIKLMLQLADEFTGIFEKLIDAYSQISEAMPQFARLQTTFGDDPNFKVVLAMVYTDILEFHRRAYKFFRKRAWHLFFDSLWKSFQFRFQGILKSLAHHQELLMKEVAVINVVDARQFYIKGQQEIERQEKQTQDHYVHDCISWLKVAGEEHDDELLRLSEKRQEGTCEWVFRNPLFKSWKDDAHGEPVLWVKGIPGAGKTILSTFVIGRMHEEGGFTTAYHICNSFTTGKNLLGDILKSIAAQFLRGNVDLAPYIFENYANKSLAPSIVRLRKLLPELLKTIPSVRIIVDGLDEYPESDQRSILTDLLTLSKTPGGNCRVLFSNREGPLISRTLGGKPTISLRDQDANVNKDIELHVHARLKELRGRFGNTLVNKIEREIVDKADGMFLWVRLVMQSLDKCDSPQELLDAVDRLPKGLSRAYGRILDDIDARSSEKAIRILQWIACSFRLLKMHEIQDGIVLQQSGVDLNANTKLVEGFLEQCKPLIEEGPKNTIDFVHYSAKEYILDKDSGPFLYYHESHYGLAYACIKYMNSSGVFIDPAHREDAVRLRVLRGFHGLHHYANEFWFQHLLQYAKSGEPVEDDELDDPLQDLEGFWRDSPGSGAKGLKLDDTVSADGIENQLSVLSSMPLAQRMGIDILTFRKFLSQEKYSHKDPESLKQDENKFDPTLFSKISQKYQTIVRFLMDCPAGQAPLGIQPHELEKFKQIYLDSAFICRYRECPRYSDGFRSSLERDEHETLHTKPLRCLDPSCEFFSRGFTSKSGLLKHNRKYHPSPEEAELPAFEPRKEPEPVHIPAPVVAPTAPPPPREPTPPPPPPEEIEDLEPQRDVPKRERVSRAKKGKLVHHCQLCPKVFTRNEGLRRHQLSHGDPQFHCNEPKCNRKFYRADLLERHVRRHEEQDETPQMPSSQNDTPEASDVLPSQVSVQSLLNSNETERTTEPNI